MLEIIAREEEWIVAVKPFGVLSEDRAEGGEGEAGMPALIREALPEAEPGQPSPEVRPVHRLDRTTEGLMVYALTKRAAAELSRAVADGEFHKTYRAYLTADPALPPSGEMRDRLFFDRRRDKAFIVPAEKARGGAKEAILRYTLGEPFLWRGQTVTPADIELVTGRTHQIRAQFGARRSPLLGDGKYGSRVNYKAPSLFCTAISFPWKGRTRSFSRPADGPHADAPRADDPRADGTPGTGPAGD